MSKSANDISKQANDKVNDIKLCGFLSAHCWLEPVCKESRLRDRSP